MLDPSLFNPDALHPIMGSVFRLIESQEKAATLNLVSSMDEQFELECLLDKAKPLYRPGTEKMHYLLKTAFRYPPLRYGSRFGSKNELSFYYASETELTCLIESAYYRFIILDHLETPYLKAINSEHSIFSVKIQCDRGLDLTNTVFKALQQMICSPSNYSLTQSIGKWVVSENIAADVIRFPSARDASGTNIAIANPSAIISKEPENMIQCLCQTTTEMVSFSSERLNRPLNVSIKEFLIDGKLPQAA